MVKRGNIENKKSSKIDKDMQVSVSKKIDRKVFVSGRRKFVISAFSLFGLVGWSVAVPTIIAAYLGMYVDEHYPSEHLSYTLYFILFGILLGCYNAMLWIRRENDKINKEYK